VKANTGKEIDIDAVEKALANADVNEFFYSTNADDVFFYNKELDFYYEKIPLKNNDATIGFLIYCSRGLNEASQTVLPQIETKRRSLDQMLDAYVRKILVDAVKEHGYNLDAIAAELRISKNSLLKKIQKYRISVEREDTTMQE
jgi:DNA-binding NtrC family response regulator